MMRQEKEQIQDGELSQPSSLPSPTRGVDPRDRNGPCGSCEDVDPVVPETGTTYQCFLVM